MCNMLKRERRTSPGGAHVLSGDTGQLDVPADDLLLGVDAL